MKYFSRIVITMVLAALSSLYALAYHNISPYAWCGGNPIKFVDPTGCIVQIDSAGMTSEQYQFVIDNLEILKRSETFNYIYSALDENPNYIITIVYGETVLDNKGNGIFEPVNAQYSPENKQLTFAVGAHPTNLQITEEVFHAFQDMNGLLLNSKYNVEFEAKTAALIVAGQSDAPYISIENGIPQTYKNSVYSISRDDISSLTNFLNDNYVRNGIIFSNYWKQRNNNHYSTPVKYIPRLLKQLLQ